MSKAITSTKRVRNFIAVSDEVLDALELLGVEYDLLGFKLLEKDELFNSNDYKIVQK